MQFPPNVKAKPTLPNSLKNISILALLFNQTAQGAFGNIYLPIDVFDNLTGPHPNPYNISLLIHEQTHLKRQKEEGIAKWLIKYFLIPKFRLDEEVLACKEQMKIIKKHKLAYPFEKQAKFLSSWAYLWPASYESVLKELKRNWEDA